MLLYSADLAEILSIWRDRAGFDRIKLHKAENEGFWLVEIDQVGWKRVLKQRLAEIGLWKSGPAADRHKPQVGPVGLSVLVSLAVRLDSFQRGEKRR